MQTVGVRELVNRASALLDELERGGQPIAVLSAIDAEEFYDYVLALGAPGWRRLRIGTYRVCYRSAPTVTGNGR